MKSAGGTFEDYQAISTARFEWSELDTLKRQYPDIHAKPELKTVKTLLKKLRKVAVAQTLQDYAQALIHDFERSDAAVISDVQGILD